MAKFSKEKESYFISKIRFLLVQRPDLTATEIKEILEKQPRGPIRLDRQYIGRLIKKIIKSRAYRINRYLLFEYLGKLEEETDEIKRRCWQVINDQSSGNTDVISALREIRVSSSEFFEKLIVAGVFEKKMADQDKLKREYNLRLWGQISPETLAVINKDRDTEKMSINEPMEVEDK